MSLTRKAGKVYLTGAGPGDPGLIVEKAGWALQRCDAVVYDHLAPLELVVTLPPTVERYFAGKSAGRHTKKQEEINQLLAELAGQGKTVVRLKGGDPYVFGRGGEEALFLREQGIPFEVIPGVTAGIAVPAYAGVPVTFRKMSSYIILLTAHEAGDKDESEVPIELLSQAEKGTIVGYMGVKTLPELMRKLMESGLSPETPALVVERGTLGIQRCINGTVATIADLALQAVIEPPALFVLGQVVELREKLAAAAALPLQGKTIMVTRPADQAGETYRRLRELGAEVLPLPVIFTEAAVDYQGWEKFWGISEGWLVFTSENGVRYFLRHYFKAGYDLRGLAEFKIAAVGSGTERALQVSGLTADFRPSKFTVKDLAEELVLNYTLGGIDVIRVRGNLGEETAEDILRGAGSKVLPLIVYRAGTYKWDEGMFNAFREAKVDFVTFTSGSTVLKLKEILGEGEFDRFIKQVPAISIGPRTSQVIRQCGGKVAGEAGAHTVEGMVEALIGRQ